MTNKRQPYLNCLVMWLPAEVCERILCWRIPNESYYVIDTGATSAWPEVRTKQEVDDAIMRDEAIVLENDHLVLALRRLESLSNYQRQNCDRAWSVIKDLVQDKEFRIMDPKQCGKMIAETAKKHEVDQSSVRKYLRRFWQRGQLEISVQPDLHKCGGAGQPRMGSKTKLGNVNGDGLHVGLPSNEQVRKHFHAAFEQDFNTEDKLTLGQVFRRMLIRHYLAGYELKDGKQSPVLLEDPYLPTFRQFRHYYDCYVVKVNSMRKRIGDRRFDQNHRGTTGDQSKTAHGIGDIYQIDATTADVYLVSSIGPSVTIPRPVIYLVIDVFSGLIVGVHLTSSGMNYNAAAAAIWNAYQDKMEFCKMEFGLVKDRSEVWPARGLPHHLLADRGEILSKASDKSIEHLGVKIDNAPAFSPTTKAFVERHFGLRNSELIKWLPGAVPESNADKAGKESHLKRASVTKMQLMDALVDRIIAFNECVREDYDLTEAMKRDGVEKRPYKIWEWGLKHANFLRDMDPLRVRVGLLPSDEGTVSTEGIKFMGLRYTCDTAEREEWFSSADSKTNKWKVTCAYDPNCVDRIFLLGKGCGEFEVCWLTPACQPRLVVLMFAAPTTFLHHPGERLWITRINFQYAHCVPFVNCDVSL